jgi:hypothetical protein
MPFDEDASEVLMTTTSQDHAAPQASDGQRCRRPAKVQRYPVLLRRTSTPHRGLAFVALALLASLSTPSQAALAHLPGTLANPRVRGNR